MNRSSNPYDLFVKLLVAAAGFAFGWLTFYWLTSAFIMAFNPLSRPGDAAYADDAAMRPFGFIFLLLYAGAVFALWQYGKPRKTARRLFIPGFVLGLAGAVVLTALRLAQAV